MSLTMFPVLILVGMVFSAHAGDLTLRELEQKINNLDKLEQNVERLQQEVITLKGELETKNNISEEITQTIGSWDNFKQRFNRLMEIEERVNNSEAEITEINNQLEYGGKQYQPLNNLNNQLPLRDHDYLKLQFLGAKDAWLGCPDSNKICDLRTCPSSNENYRHFDNRCWGEDFQIIGEGTSKASIKSGHRIRLRYLREHNTWMGCASNKNCDKRTCPGTTSQGSNFANNRCYGEIFIIFARGRTNGQVIYNGDVVMLYYQHNGRYVSIQGKNYGDDTSLDFCPGMVPPAYLSYGICSKNVFRIHRKP